MCARLRGAQHGDLVGKTMLLQYPDLLTHQHCPSYSRQSDALSAAPGDAPWEGTHSCRTLVTPVEHVRHPVQGCQKGGTACKYITAGTAAHYASRLFADVRNYSEGGRPALPHQLFMYGDLKDYLSSTEMASVSRAAVRNDPLGSVCGRHIAH